MFRGWVVSDQAAAYRITSLGLPAMSAASLRQSHGVRRQCLVRERVQDVAANSQLDAGILSPLVVSSAEYDWGGLVQDLESLFPDRRRAYSTELQPGHTLQYWLVTT